MSQSKRRRGPDQGHRDAASKHANDSAREPRVEGAWPVTISDRSCAALTGLSARAWRTALRTLAVPHAKIGRRLVCTAASWRAAVDRRAGVSGELEPFDEAALVTRVVGDGR